MVVVHGLSKGAIWLMVKADWITNGSFYPNNAHTSASLHGAS